ncbi:MAG: sigma-70 family RNA polymerase sigma factor [Stutzerimonas stutzeri]|nr:MAG: sigma-70 family RNA polymerase sigma factor [Stutzerimonas stutzeri]
MKATLDPSDVASKVQDARRGSQPAFTWLHHRFAPLVYAIHLGMTSRARAEELTQETFAIAFGKLAQLRDTASFGPWIAMIARRNRPLPDAHERDLAEVDEPIWPGAGPESMALAGEALRAVRRLPQAYRETLILRLVEGLSGAEIAHLTGLTPASVRVNLHRGMAQLREALGIAVERKETDDVRNT